MNHVQRNGAPVLARNCEIGCASFISGDIPLNHSPPGFLGFSFSKFQEIGGNQYVLQPYGLPIATYMKEYRVHQAMKLLRETDATTADIAAQVGYETQGKSPPWNTDFQSVAARSCERF